MVSPIFPLRASFTFQRPFTRESVVDPGDCARDHILHSNPSAMHLDVFLDSLRSQCRDAFKSFSESESEEVESSVSLLEVSSSVRRRLCHRGPATGRRRLGVKCRYNHIHTHTNA